jgi:cytochrome c biogenesis protein CcdA/thiol-disulfide isomerase/thioredoxin
MLKRFFQILSLSFFALFLFIPAVLAEGLVPDDELKIIEMFDREECKHCQDAHAFFEELGQERDDFTVNYYDISEEANKEMWSTVTDLEGIPKVTPIILVGDTIIEGFDRPTTTGVMIESILDSMQGSYSFEELIAAGGLGNVESVTGGTCDDDETCSPDAYQPLLVNVPFMGTKDVKQFSLPVMSFILGFIDGFNPCAMWVLVTFLIVLMQVGNKKRMWQIAGLFIVAEAVMYYLILNVWFGVWDFIGLDQIVTPIVGVLAVGGGLFFLWEGLKYDGTCVVTNSKQKKNIRNKIKSLAAGEFTLLTILGVLGLAFSVNIIEFACSVGIPQAFTKVLEINQLTFIETQIQMAIYILFYMIDDLIVFGIALYSFEKIGITAKYTKVTNIIGGVLMLLLGALLVFAPELLVL